MGLISWIRNAPVCDSRARALADIIATVYSCELEVFKSKRCQKYRIHDAVKLNFRFTLHRFTRSSVHETWFLPSNLIQIVGILSNPDAGLAPVGQCSY
jgi:hypothetical protein